MSEHTSSIRYVVGIEGAEESVKDIQGLMHGTSAAIGLVTSLDYSIISWQRTAAQFSVTNFARSVLSTISLIQSLITVTKMAEMAQQAYNVALAIGHALSPAGWAVLAAGIPIASVTTYQLMRMHGESTAGVSASVRSQATSRLRESEDRLREEYRSTVP